MIAPSSRRATPGRRRRAVQECGLTVCTYDSWAMVGPPPDLDLRDRVAGSNTTDPRTRERKEAETRRSSGRGAENRRPGEPGSDDPGLFERDGQRSARVRGRNARARPRPRRPDRRRRLRAGDRGGSRARFRPCGGEGGTRAAGRFRQDHEGRVADQARRSRGVRSTGAHRRQALRDPGRPRWQGPRSSGVMQHLKERYPRVWSFLAARFAPGGYLGLHLTIGFLISALGLWIFLGVTEDVVHNDPLTQVDVRLLNWLQAHHGPVRDQVFRAISALGSQWVFVPLGLAVTVFLVIRKEGLLLEGWLLAFVGGFLLNNVLKSAIRRPRPLPGAGLYHSWSFPSGHAMVSLIAYGMLAYLLIVLGTRNRRTQIGIVAWVALLVLAIGFSRLYLGAHYFSDVVGGYAAGMLWLSACISGLEVARRWRAT